MLGKRAWVVATGLAILLQANAVAQTVLFSSDMTDATGWGYSHFGGTDAPTQFDSATAEFDWDYSMMGIPEAPSSSIDDVATRGLRMTANDTGAFRGDQIAVHYQDDAFTGRYTLQVDVWANWASNDGSGSGTTEHVGVYVGFDPDDVDAFSSPAQNGAGILFDTDGACGNCDYILTKDAAELDIFSGQYGETDFGFGNQQGYDNTDANSNVDIPALFPELDIAAATNNLNGSGTQPAGAAGYQWMTVTVEVDTAATGNGTNGSVGTATFSLQSAASGNTLTVGTVDNSVDDDPADGIDTGEAPVGMDGGIALMMVDFFTGSPQPIELGFMVFDNVRVFVDDDTPMVDADFNDDTVLDCTDVDGLVAAIAAGGDDPAFDLTGDGFVDVADLNAWLSDAGALNNASGGAYLSGDANLDGSVDVADFNIWNSNKFTNTPAWCSGDFTADGVVDISDFNAWNGEKFNSSDGAAAVPEPATAVLLCVGLSALGLRRR